MLLTNLHHFLIYVLSSLGQHGLAGWVLFANSLFLMEMSFFDSFLLFQEHNWGIKQDLGVFIFVYETFGFHGGYCSECGILVCETLILWLGKNILEDCWYLPTRWHCHCSEDQNLGLFSCL